MRYILLDLLVIILFGGRSLVTSIYLSIRELKKMVSAYAYHPDA